VQDRAAAIRLGESLFWDTPTVINSIFNHRSFWEGRAQSDFNGVDPFGARNAGARVVKIDLTTGTPHLVSTGIQVPFPRPVDPTLPVHAYLRRHTV
jgi:hypothetical protein